MDLRTSIFAFAALTLCACHFGNAAGDGTISTSRAVPEDSLTIALRAIDQRIVADPGNARLYAERARLYINKDSTKRAITDAERAVTLDSGNVNNRLMLGDLYYISVRLDNAMAQYNAVIAIDPRNVPAMLKLAEIQLVQRQYELSMKLVNDALRINPNAAHGYYIKGWIHMETHDTTVAISSFHTAVEQDPQDYKAYMMLGKLSAARHDPLAEQFYNTAIELHPRSVEAWYDKAIYCQDHGKDSIALECYKHIMEIDTMNALAWYNSGFVRMEHLNDFAHAKSDFSHAIALQPNYTDAWYNRGVAMEKSNELDSAAANYQVCLSIAPGHSLAAESLDRLAKRGVHIRMFDKKK